MKIMFFIDLISVGGITVSLKSLSDNLLKKGHEIVFVGEQISEQIQLGTKFYNVKNLGITYKYVDISLIRNILRKEKPDIVILNNFKNGYIIGKLFKEVPVVTYFCDGSVACYGGDRFWLKSKKACQKKLGLSCYYYAYSERCSFRNPIRFLITYIQKYLEITAYRKMDALLVNSTYTKSLLLQLSIFKNINILPHYVEDNGRGDEKENGRYSRKDKLIVFLGRVCAEKGVLELVDIFKLLTNQDAKLLIYGTGPEVSVLNKAIQRSKLEDKILLKGYVGGDEKQAVLSSASVLVVPSIYPEAFGIVGIEAMINRVPVVAYDVGGIKDWLFDGENGYLVPCKDKISMAKRIDLLLSNPELSQQMGSKGYKIFREKFSSEKIASQFLEICKDVISKFKRKSKDEN